MLPAELANYPGRSRAAKRERAAPGATGMSAGLSPPGAPTGWCPCAGRRVADAVVVVEGGRIADVGPRAGVEPVLVPSARRPASPSRGVDLGRVALMPPLVNAHTHLELSWMAGPAAARPPTMPEWAQALVALRAASQADEVEASARGRRAVARVRHRRGRRHQQLAGVVRAAVAQPAARRRVPRAAWVQPGRPRRGGPAPPRTARAPPQSANVGVTLAAHAPVFGGARAVPRDRLRGRRPGARPHGGAPRGVARGSRVPARRAPGRGGRCSSRSARGPTRGTCRGAARSSTWRASGFCAAGCWWCTACTLTARGTGPRWRPRGDGRHVPAQQRRGCVSATPPVRAMLASGVNVAIGTDSLASNDDLNVFAELAALRALAPDASPAHGCWRWPRSTAHGPCGSNASSAAIEAGKRAELIAVGMPEANAPTWKARPGAGRRAVAGRVGARMSRRRPPGHLRVVRAVQPLGLRAALRAGRRDAGGAHLAADRGRASGGSSRRW